ncbi:uncharacterized protein A4U43_C03F21000 [Asparagus officinalis]|uniref:Peptidase C45 hydrolase domain-containing protein n=1 Tax=Asparagus officinalis TaxID=4686 RepID=A0A5P1FG22_ASPOF|nr:uncharacterized protein LOC109834137 [Asparagus officinalis]ONK75829.1 uncharacterized protein A4U43_C03F21000 [Asparagus officinalis]
MDIFDVGPCKDSYQLGFLIGQRFSDLIRSRVVTDLILQHQLLPFSRTPEAEPLIESLCSNNKQRFPRYWDELLGTAQGSRVSALELILVNFRKEILPFIPKTEEAPKQEDTASEDCSDVLIVNDSTAFLGHNEDANVALVGHTYLVRVMLPTGLSFTAYTYAGELPSCAFGFNSHGVAFTLNAVPPSNDEILEGGIGRNFISRDLLEATNISDALNRLQSSNASVGHSYNLVDMQGRKIFNVETASNNRFSIHEAGARPFFHANMYLHLKVQQVQNESSISRQRRAALLPAESKENTLALLGDCEDEEYPIYMTGPTLYTLCTVLIDLDDRTLTIIQGQPKKRRHSFFIFNILSAGATTNALTRKHKVYLNY